MKMQNMATTAFSVAMLSALAFADTDPSLDPTADYVLDGQVTFSAAAGTTNVYSGLISGTGSAIISGGGTVAFSHPNNTYSGGTRVQDAVFRLDANGCAGLGAITAAVNTAHVYMNCSYVPNDMYFDASCTGDKDDASLKPSDYPAAGTHPLYPLAQSVTVDGNVKFRDYGIYTSGTSADGFTNPTVTFNGDFTSGGRMDMALYGKTIIKGRYYSGSGADYRQHLGKNYFAYGTVELHSPSNRIKTCSLASADIYLKAKDALPYSLLFNMTGGSNYGKLFLCGNDQTFRGVCWATKDTPPSPGETATGQCWSSEDAPATVRIVGCDSNVLSSVISGSTGRPTFVNKLALFGKITLVMDVDPAITQTGFFQDFSVRRSTTTGDLIISNGDFRVSGTASFPNVRNIYVGTGGSFSNASTKAAAFAGCRNMTVLGTMACTGDSTPFGYDTLSLTLGANAKFAIPAGTTLTVRSLNVNGVEKPEGTYGDGGTLIAQIKQGTIVVRPRDRYVDCNTGNDANDGSAENPFKTIRAATSVAISGDTIHVAPGVYGNLEGSQKWPNETSAIGTRVVIPSGVTVESTDGAAATFIVGQMSSNPAVSDGWQAGIGPDAVRCVVAGSGATLRGFTLTGGYTHAGTATLTEDRYGSAFYTTSDNPATIEDCIVSNNVSSARTLFYGVVRRCRVIGNTAAADGENTLSSSAGIACSWYNTIIAGNRGNATLVNPRAVESCTLGGGNIMSGSGMQAQVLYWTDSPQPMFIVNTAWLYGGCQLYRDLYCTNCIVMSDILVGETATHLRRENAYNTIFTNAAAAQVDEEWRPVFGSFVGIDKGDIAYASAAIGDTDVFCSQRIMNGVMDIGAVEYDWRPVFAVEFGRRFKIVDVSPEVTINANGGLRMPSGHVLGTVSSKGPYEVSFEVDGGCLAVYAGGMLVGESSGSGVQSLRFEIPVASSVLEFMFTPDAESPGTAVLRKFSGVGGFVLTFQ